MSLTVSKENVGKKNKEREETHMAGPGGGGFGGGGGRGFGGGGGFGGGFGGGGRGFGGGYHHHHHGPHFRGGWFFGPRFYYGGGCLGGLLGMMFAPIILILVAGGLLLSSFGSAFHSLSTGGDIAYNEEALQDYANAQYFAAFGAEKDSEDQLLLVFLIEDEQYYDYAYIAWCGDHIQGKIGAMFGAEGTRLGSAIQNSAINSSTYKYSLDSGIAQVMGTMQGHIEALGLESSLICNSGASNANSSYLINRANIDMTADTVNAALESFTEATGIPVIVVVEDAEEVLPKNFDWFSVIIAGVLIVIAIVLIVKAFKNRPKKQEDDGSYKGSSQNNYNNGNYDNNNYNNSGW